MASGRVELGFQQLSELQNLAGIQVVGPLPPAIQSITVFSGAISATSADVASALALLAYMAEPAATSLNQKHGMDAA